MSHTITLTGNYGYTPYKISSGLDAGSTIDASAASWIVANSRNSNPVSGYDANDGSLPINQYPFQVLGAGPGLIIKGGTINGEVPQASDWEYTYANSAAIRVDLSPGAVIEDWRITKPWDGIRLAGTSNTTFTINDVWISNSRDDAVENDDVLGGSIKNSLFDEVFSGISLGDGDADGSDNTVTIEDVLLRSKSYLYKGEMTHGSPMKMDSSSGDVTPSLRFINTVFAIEDVDHIGQGRLQKAWDKTVESRGNVFLNLSDTPLPSDYPKPGAGWTILQGEAARDYWEAARAKWIANHDGITEPPSVEKEPLLVLDSERATFEGFNFNGDDGDEVIVGNALNNNIDGGNGDDIIKGAGGNDILRGDKGIDTLWGGPGNDTFIFKHTSDSREADGIDTIMDFTAGDKIDLRTIDANTMVSGDQAFQIITGSFTKTPGTKTPGQLEVAFDAASGNTVITGNTDADTAAEFMIQLSGKITLTAGDFLL
jgi:Ca2+-binding RTX toxin-like protein